MRTAIVMMTKKNGIMRLLSLRTPQSAHENSRAFDASDPDGCSGGDELPLRQDVHADAVERRHARRAQERERGAAGAQQMAVVGAGDVVGALRPREGQPLHERVLGQHALQQRERDGAEHDRDRERLQRRRR